MNEKCLRCAEKDTRIQALLERNNIDLEWRRTAESGVRVRDEQLSAHVKLLSEWIERADGFEEALNIAKAEVIRLRKSSAAQIARVGKKAAGRILDGRTHDGIPMLPYGPQLPGVPNFGACEVRQ